MNDDVPIDNKVFRFWAEDNYEYEIFSVLSITHAWTSVILSGKGDSRRHFTTSFSENVDGSGGNKLSNERSFTTLLSGESLTFMSINNRTNFIGEKSKMKLSGLSFFENTRKETLS